MYTKVEKMKIVDYHAASVAQASSWITDVDGLSFPFIASHVAFLLNLSTILS